MNCDVVLDSCLKKSDPIEMWIDSLRDSGVDYVLVNKNSDFQKYSFLGDSKYSEKILKDDFAYILKFSSD